MKQLFLFGLFFISVSAAAQNFKISGKVVNADDGSPLPSATIFVEKLQDSSLVSYTISNEEGDFVIEGSTSEESLRLISNYAGYVPLQKVISMENPEIELGILEMTLNTNELGEVMVIATRAPVTVKADTLQFNAASFNTRQNANLEDVLKKLPGVEVDPQGNITVNGKPVSRILVNGEEFFGTDPKIATKNLPKEIIDKIQVVNTKTKTEEFTGKAGNPDDKTINITLQEDKNKGYFARLTAGGGTDERYELSGIANYFKDDLRVSVLASSNNINSAGFSFDEVFDMMGGRARTIMTRSNGSFAINGIGFGGGEGITKSETAGFNFTNKWEEDYELAANYFFGRNDTETRTLIQRENFLPSGTYYTNAASEGDLINDSHRANLALEVEFDTLTKLSIRPAFVQNNGFSSRQSETETFNEDRVLTNASETLENEELQSVEFSNSISFIRRFGGRGAFLQADFENENERRESDNLFISERLTFGGDAEIFLQDQIINEESESDKYSFGVSQRSVLSDDLFLDVSYDFSTMSSENIRDVFELDPETQDYDDYNELLSSNFSIASVEHIPNAGINYEGEKLRTGFDIGLLSTSLESEDYLSGTSFDRTFNNLFLSANLRYEIKQGTSIYVDYRTMNEVPEIWQMQPVPNLTNPLNTIIGNPELKPSYRHRIYIGYNAFDFATRSGFNFYGGANFAEDAVVPYTITNEDLISTTTYTNVDGGFDSYLGSSYNKRIKKEETEYSYRLSGNFNYGREIGFSNEVKYTANRFSTFGRIALGYNYNDQVEINPRYEIGYTRANYDISNDREEEYVNHTIGLEATTYWPENIVFGNDIAFSKFGNISPGFDPTSLLWNMSLGYEFLDDDATIKVKVYDLLNENISTTRRTGQNYVQDTQELILEQYVMLTFTYKLSKFGGKDPNENGSGIMRF